MARKVLNRKALREQADAAEKLGEAEGGAKVKKAAKTKEKKEGAPKKKSRTKTPVVVRMKLFWGIFNQSMKRIALYEYSQRKQADLKAQELNAAGKSQHFVQKVKEEVTEKAPE